MTVNSPPIVCLCGSTRFAAEFNRHAERLTLAGNIVVRPEVVTYSAEADPQLVAPDVKRCLDELHLRKIDLADSVLVLNVDGYIGESTKRELAYAIATKKVVDFVEPERAEEFMEQHSHELGRLVGAFVGDCSRRAGL